jgi:dihydroorotase
MHLFAGKAQFSLCHAMTELLAMGIPLEATIPMVTSHCATVLRMDDELGSLAPGRSADISALRDETGSWELCDNSGVTVRTDRRLTPAFCIRNGQKFEADAPILPV